MEVKASPAILIVFLLYSYVLSAISIPASRGFIPTKEDSQGYYILAQDGEASKMEGGHPKWKMGSDSTDYKDHGPTQHHDPRSSITEIKDNANFLEMEGEKMEGRMDMESLYDPRTTNNQIKSDRKFSEVERDLQVEDYKGPGSNPRHDPNNPPSG